MEDQKVQEIERKKRYLKRYRKNLALVIRLEEKLFLLEQRLTTVRSPKLSGMPRGGTPVTHEELITDKDELIERIARQKKKGLSYKREIWDEIDKLEDVRYAEILEAFFIDGLSLDEIAEKDGYTTRYVYQLYSDAIRTLVELDCSDLVQ